MSDIGGYQTAEDAIEDADEVKGGKIMHAQRLLAERVTRAEEALFDAERDLAFSIDCPYAMVGHSINNDREPVVFENEDGSRKLVVPIL